MSPSDQKTTRKEIADEQAANSRYLKFQDEQDASQYPTQGPRNNLASGTGHGRRPSLPRGPLIGRVALDEPSSDLDNRREYYIGARKADRDGLLVFSWTAPIASTFFRSTNDDPLYDRVWAVRTFVLRANEVVDFSDDLFQEPGAGSPFSVRQLRIAEPPRRAPLPIAATPKGPQSPPRPREGRPPTPPQPTPKALEGAGRPPRTAPQPTTPPQTPTGPAPVPLRAAGALRKSLEAPRGRTLSSVLATLQADQYDLVTRSADRPLVIQGHPGSGKTIIASHRAAFLVHPESRTSEDRSARTVTRVLILGPTDGYVRHVQGALNALHTPTEFVQVRTLEEFLLELRGEKPARLGLHGSMELSYQDVDASLLQLAERAARLARGMTMNSRGPVERTYETLRRNGITGQPLTTRDLWPDYLASLPMWKAARNERRLSPLIAACSVAVKGSQAAVSTFDHLIVDEAQDVRPLEWALLDRVNLGGWTIVGDMNQRRSDTSYHNWDHLVAELGLDGDPGTKLPEVMRRGYRSTTEIMRFAGALLPKAERGLASVQSGTEPVIAKVGAGLLPEALVDRVEELSTRHGGGTVAAIAVDPTRLRRQLRERGWETESAGSPWWVRDSARTWIGTPEDARGLEFDAVVVCEPADFVPNAGRHGLLYTSLTRANRELVVLHSSPLPAGLKTPRRGANPQR